MVIKCDECNHEFLGEKLDETKIFICRFCMGEGISPSRWDDRLKENQKALEKAVKWWRFHREQIGLSSGEEETDFSACVSLIKN